MTSFVVSTVNETRFGRVCTCLCHCVISGGCPAVPCNSHKCIPVYASFSLGHALLEPFVFAAELELSAAFKHYFCSIMSFAGDVESAYEVDVNNRRHLLRQFSVCTGCPAPLAGCIKASWERATDCLRTRRPLCF